jgi:hypothetical protein
MESRRAVRIVAAVGIIVEIDGKAHPCLTRTVSAGGMLVQLRHPAMVGTPTTVVIPEAGSKLRLSARIANNDGSALGLALDPSAPEALETWGRFLKKLVRRSTEEIDPSILGVSGEVSWAHVPDGKLLTVFRKRLHKDRLIDLTVDGAAFANPKPPALESYVLVFLTEVSEGERKEYHCQAAVVRHLDGGFAVRFDAPAVEFRRVVSRLRRSLVLA